MATSGAEIGDAKTIDIPQTVDFFPQARHGPRIKYLKFKPSHIVQNCPPAQFHQNGKGRDFPQHDLGPATLKRQFVLVTFAFEEIGRQTQLFEPLHEVGLKHLAFAIKRVAAQPCAFAATETE